MNFKSTFPINNNKSPFNQFSFQNQYPSYNSPFKSSFFFNNDQINEKRKIKRFTPHEDQLILQGFSKFGKNWSKIIEWSHLDRTSSQISSRFSRKLKKLLSQSKNHNFRSYSNQSQASSSSTSFLFPKSLKTDQENGAFHDISIGDHSTNGFNESFKVSQSSEFENNNHNFYKLNKPNITNNSKQQQLQLQLQEKQNNGLKKQIIEDSSINSKSLTKNSLGSPSSNSRKRVRRKKRKKKKKKKKKYKKKKQTKYKYQNINLENNSDQTEEIDLSIVNDQNSSRFNNNTTATTQIQSQNKDQLQMLDTILTKMDKKITQPKKKVRKTKILSTNYKIIYPVQSLNNKNSKTPNLENSDQKEIEKEKENGNGKIQKNKNENGNGNGNEKEKEKEKKNEITTNNNNTNNNNTTTSATTSMPNEKPNKKKSNDHPKKKLKKNKKKEKKSKKELKKKLEKYKMKYYIYKGKCERLENEVQESKDVAQKLEELESEYKDHLLKEREITSRAREEIYRLMIFDSQHEKKKLREQVRKENLRLGTFKMKRIGLTYETEYIHGEDFQKIHEKISKCVREEEKIKELRKILHTNKPVPISDSSRESLEQQNPEYLKQLARYHQQEEVYKLRLATIRKEKVELEKERSRLKIQKHLQLKQIRRLENEENSRFRGNPLLKNNRYLVLSLLGKGGFSEVFKTYDLQEFRLVACKFHQLNINWKPEQSRNYLKHSLREYEIQKSLNHKKIVRLFDVFEVDEQSFCTIMEYCPRGDLDTLLKTKRTLVERQARSIITQIFEGLEYLNSQRRKIIHYDLKPGNILFDDDGIKITDFGLSKITVEEDPKIELTSQGSGTHWYLPPECFERKNVPMISSKVDVWSVGIMFFQMLYGYRPFGEKMSPIDLWNQNVIINQGKNIEFPKKPNISNPTKDFIKLCLTYDQEKRPDVLTIAQHPYLNPHLKKK
ncbi:tousled-like kinase isoform g [Anaeramoeba flamelloides]|uniref:Tousled-like kinase isoform g n=1 Tax=Anaeramoeba flamelloides TaxID=1746091 RepID=A0AAV7YUJ4_9EUKA|nr:tousled-like kinase isoform g [Anaeramoeba flamelloides]